jgi:hypothetical protein
MRHHSLRLTLVLLFAFAAAPAMGAARPPSARGPTAGHATAMPSHPASPGSTRGSFTTDRSGRPTVRRVFIGVPTFVGSAFWDPFWPGPSPWGWYGYGSLVYVPVSGGTMQVAPLDVARLGLHVSPRKADIVIDGNDVGEARDYDADFRPLWLSPGDHVLELRYLGYQTLRIRLDVNKGQVSDLHYKLRAGSGLDERSSQAEIPSALTGARKS